MRYYAPNLDALHRSRGLWDDWHAKAAEHVSRFADRWAELIEQRLGRPRPHVSEVAEAAMVQTEGEVGRLTPEELVDVIDTLFKVWVHGVSLRVWARKQGLLSSDR